MNNMIKIVVGTGLQRTEMVVSSDTTIMQACEEAGLNIGAGGITFNGSTVRPDEFNKTFADFNIVDKCFLMQVVKADNA